MCGNIKRNDVMMRW